MNCVLVFIPKSRYVFKAMLEGVSRFFSTSDTKIQVVEYGGNVIDLRKLLDFWSPRGCIVEGSYGLPSTLASGKFGKVPVVYLDKSPRKPGVAELEVRCDEKLIGETAAREIISPDLQHYAFVGHPIHGLSWSDERGNAYVDTLKLNHLSCSRFETPRSGNRDATLRKWLEQLPKPCGLFAANDFTAEGVINICSTIGLEIPKDVRIVSFDNDEMICNRTDPKITSLCPDYDMSGFLCGQLLSLKWSKPQLRKRLMTYGLNGIIRRGSSARALNMGAWFLAASKAIRDHACETSFTVTDVAKAMGCSKRLAEMRFAQTAGHTIKREIDDVRHDNVCLLLSTTQHPIGTIANECGYGTSAALRTAFRKRTGMSLRDWRKANKKRT